MASKLYARNHDIGGGISVYVPTVGEVIDNEKAYFDAVFSIISTPYDVMVQLDDAGIDFSRITDYDLFTLMFQKTKTLDTSLIFGDLDLSGFDIQQNTENGDIVIRNDEYDMAFDIVIHDRLCRCLRDMLNIEKVDKKPGNEEAKQYMIDTARRKMKRRLRKRNERDESMLEPYIVALVNHEGCPYDYNTIRDITIYQFYSSLKQINHKTNYENVMSGYYAGTIKKEDLKMSDRTWIRIE